MDYATNPIPKFYGKSWATHPGVPVNANEQQDNAAVLARVFKLDLKQQNAREAFARGKVQ